MWRSNSQLVALALAVASVALARPADACGPDFPQDLITHRASALETLWDGSFLDEAMHLTTPPPDVVPPPDAGDATSDAEDQLYRRAATAWHAGELDVARRGFEAVLRLPADQRRHRSTAAAFMLGDHARVRRLIAAGFYDEHYLAAFELGEQARRALAADHLEDAVHLYAQQAAAGDPGGARSLLLVVRAAVKHPASVQRLLRDDVGLGLLAAYAYARRDELGDAAPALWTQVRERAGARGVALHLLAAGAYREGEWADAAAFAARAPGEVLAQWVLAKLALRDGDTHTAQRYLAQVEAAHARYGATIDGTPDNPLARVRGELGLVALADQRFADALAWFRRGGETVDASYVAERVLTIDEMRATVEARGPRSPEDYTTCWWRDDGAATTDCWDRNLSTVLARRLMRAGRFAEAIPYLDPSLQKHARAYAAFRGAADRDDDPIDRARDLLGAAGVARGSGMEILGTESAPDFSMYAGDFTQPALCAPGAATPTSDDDDLGDGCISPTAADRGFISAAETARVAASAPADGHRFHYRYLASRLAEQAADLLPPRSQAFAASLCIAAKDIEYVDPARVHALYRRYVREGAYGFGGGFGDRCPAPDLAKARTFERDHAPPSRWTLARWRATLAHHPWLWLVLLGGIGALGITGIAVASRRAR